MINQTKIINQSEKKNQEKFSGKQKRLKDFIL